ncbi:trypsin-like peptidase domain-containing protein [Polluticaenibacter yanchengensis]|uniref:Trypsin-like peptidase domain-containing protein n=1 Tax=Polluticaenibacter yanchengensis TaxID=3014562 RepID=A0ABT4UPK9_9BACT|nr:trypsin-like peptidase domain-containing protein [Chitinophagaceae bacterium LY-5]
MKLGQGLAVVGLSVASAFAAIWGYNKVNTSYIGNAYNNPTPANYASFDDTNLQAPYQIDFTAAASAATPAVVHIKTKISSRTVVAQNRSPFADLFGDEFFGDMFGGGGSRTMQIPEQRASGSGVLISGDGYIITNNHVIDKANEINVTLTNKKTYKATLVGADPNSDLAVLKIEGSGFPYIKFGNSDDVKLGQWVLAIGYPWSLDVTVTAGIVSAKARTLDMPRRGSSMNDSPVESFIQTDAAVNQGNSGGALVDANGQLIGINAAIASQTGSYAGYSYAIPVNITKKITSDIIKYGAVQRAYLGINYTSENAQNEERLRENNIKIGEGVYVGGVTTGGAAEKAGIKVGDYITGINGVKITSGSEMVEQVANYRPGDKVNVTYQRNGSEKTTSAVLLNRNNDVSVVKADAKLTLDEKLGAEFATLPAKKAEEYNVNGGVQVKKIKDNGAIKRSKIQEEFIIISINGQQVKTVEELTAILNNASGTVRVEGIYPGFDSMYAYPLTVN